ncbi:MAG: YfhO family protein [Lachnospiraceae bacterium]|nr:YfhO family protein [Lachnospiraceae bacterium]
MKKLKDIPRPLAAFLLALPVWLIFLAGYDVLGFGNNTILRGDLQSQYIDFISLFLRFLKGDESFWYSFSVYLGSGTVLTHAYYCLSPFNLLYLIEAVPLPAMTAVIIGLKFACAAAAFAFFAEKILKRRDLYALLFSLCYAFNGFSVSFYFNMVWLDTLYMLPLAVFLLFRLMEGRHFALHSLCWAYIFLTNFYLSYMAGIFVALLFAALLILRCPREGRPRFILRQCLRFFLSILLAAGLSAAVLLPAALYLLSHMAADNIAFEGVSATLFDLVTGFFAGVMPDMDNQTPLMYCGLPVLLLVPFYFTDRRFSKKERLLAGILLLLLFVSLLWSPLFIFWHAFDTPNWYLFRFSFCISFLLCALACRRSGEAEGVSVISPRALWVYTLGLIVFCSLMRILWVQYIRPGNRALSADDFTYNAAFLLLWATLFTLRKRLVPLFSLILIMGELSLNAVICARAGQEAPTSESEYLRWAGSESAAVSQIKEADSGSYRIAVNGELSHNAPSLFGYAGFNTFSTSDSYALRNALHGLGISAVNRAIMEHGYTPLAYLLLGMKYTVTLPTESNEPAGISKADYALPPAYMVREDILQYTPGDNPFENQEELLRCMSGKSYPLYREIPEEELIPDNSNIKILDTNGPIVFEPMIPSVPEATLFFGADNSDQDDFYACFYRRNPEARTDSAFVIGAELGLRETPDIDNSCILRGIPFDGQPSGRRYAGILLKDGKGDYCDAVYFVRYDASQLKAVYETLSEHPLKLSENKGELLRGRVTASEEAPILFTSIPYDKDWQASIDGSRAELISTLDGAFLALRLSPGEHEVELRYVPAGRSAGAMISLLSLAMLLLTAIAAIRKPLRSA